MFRRAVIATFLLTAAAAGQLPCGDEAPAGDTLWGRTRAGAQAGLTQADEWYLKLPLKLRLTLRNTGKLPVTLAGGKRAFGYVLVAQGGNVWFSERIYHAEADESFPARLAPGKSYSPPVIDLAGLTAFAYGRHLKTVGGYPTHLVGGKPRKIISAGKLGDLLRPGKVQVKYVAYFDRGDEGPLALVAGWLKAAVRLKDFPRLDAATRKALLADLARRLRADAWSASAACRDAADIGEPAVATVAKVARDERAESFARMWATTALAAIGGERAEGILIDLLDDAVGSVRHVVAYHGLRAGSDKLDRAVTARAVAGKDPMVTAWAIMGYLKFREEVPPKLLAAGVDSPEWKTRAAVVETIARGKPDRTHLPILRKLLADEQPAIRREAAQAVGYVGDLSDETFAALVAALEPQGDQARAAVAAALCRLTGKDWIYTREQSADQRRAVRTKWRQWWQQRRKQGEDRPAP
jgi:HEAT repeat protein